MGLSSRTHARAGIAVLACLASGCDQLFSLDHVESPVSDASFDARALDSSPACTATTQHDEDGDGLVDSCDACPTVTSTAMDTDGDGLTDACDPDLSTSADGDRIVFAAMFASSNELATLFDTSGTGAAASVTSDNLVLPAGAQAAVKTTSVPTRMVIEVASLSGATAADGLMFAQNGASCSVTGSGCAGEKFMSCVTFGTNTTEPFDVSSVTRVTISRASAGMLTCQIDTASGIFEVSTAGTFQNSIPFVRAVGTGQTTVKSFVIYGEK